jgi:hypothetical protein
MFRRVVFLSSLTVSLVAGCSEAKNDDGAAGGGTGGGASSSTGGSGGGTAGAGGGDTSSTSSSMTQGDVVVNELSATEDWVELFNRGDAAADLSGLGLADQDTPGVPKSADAITFPEGTMLAPGAYLFVLAKQNVDPGEQTPQSTCAPGSSPCFFAPFGLSDADGDAVFLLDGDTILDTAEYPSGAVGAEQTWCRLPNGTGAFEACAPTPSAENAAP